MSEILIAKSFSDKVKLFNAADDGDVFFSSTRSISSWTVRKVIKFQYSHTFTKVNSRTIIDADIGGIKIRPINTYLRNSQTAIELVRLPKCVDRFKYIECLNRYQGALYDYGVLVGGILSRILHLSRWQENMFNGVSRFTCSELVATSLIEAGMEFKLPTSQITPKDLYYSLIAK